MDLRTKAILVALQRDEDLYLNTRNPRHAWQQARRATVSVPGWVLRFIDGIAEQGIAAKSRKTDTADRYEAALTQMDAAVDRHRNRLAMRKVAQQFGVHAEISRRDRPNLSAIARQAALEHHVSVNRLLARYRRSR